MVVPKLSQRTGWKKHETFGLRKEWVHVYLSSPRSWFESSELGNRQVQSLQAWIRTSGFIDAHGHETDLYRMFQEKGTEYRLAWEILWVNVVFNWPTARWYISSVDKGMWTTTELVNMLCKAAPQLAKRTVQDAILELVGLLQHTPVGSELGQGEVSSSRPREIKRRGLPDPSWEAIYQAFSRLLEEEGRKQLGLNENLLWPWLVFGCSRDQVIKEILITEDERIALDDKNIYVS
jgi:hypothetical protein